MLSGIQQNTLMDNDPLAHGYYVADLLVALAVVVLMLRARRTRPELARMLLLGTLIGLVWELPVFGLSAWTNTPIIEWATPLPLPTVVFLLAHSVWDGPLLTMGWLLARALTGEPAGALGLTVQVLWGQLTALAVELSAILAGTWSYVDDLWFNPVMFWFRGHPVTAPRGRLDSRPGSLPERRPVLQAPSASSRAHPIRQISRRFLRKVRLQPTDFVRGEERAPWGYPPSSDNSASV